MLHLVNVKSSTGTPVNSPAAPIGIKIDRSVLVPARTEMVIGDTVPGRKNSYSTEIIFRSDADVRAYGTGLDRIGRGVYRNNATMLNALTVLALVIPDNRSAICW